MLCRVANCPPQIGKALRKSRLLAEAYVLLTTLLYSEYRVVDGVRAVPRTAGAQIRPAFGPINSLIQQSFQLRRTTGAAP